LYSVLTDDNIMEIVMEILNKNSYGLSIQSYRNFLLHPRCYKLI